jgi:hypothetical protein
MKYTEPFYTKAIDIWVEPEAENAKRAYRALVEVGAPMADLTADDLTQPHIVFQFGMAPARVDVMTTIDALTFPEAWKNRVETHFEQHSDFHHFPAGFDPQQGGGKPGQ